MQETSPQLAGQVLIAMPGMNDARFGHAVIYICSHSDQGAMGLIVNKPVPELRFAQVLDQLGIKTDQNCPDIGVQFGGPVETGRGFVLHSSDYQAGAGTLAVEDTVGMTGTSDILQDMARGLGPAKSLLALGYSGWGPGQLEDEIARNVWLTAKAVPEILFGRAHELKWTAALRGLGVDPRSLSAISGRA